VIVTQTTEAHPYRSLRVVLVVWSGYIGGAETFTANLAVAMRERGADARLAFILNAGDLREHLRRSTVPYTELGLSRGRGVIRERHRFAQMVGAMDPDVAILASSGYLAAALKSGGFRRPIIAVEHGSLLQMHQMGLLRRTIYRADRASGVRACSAIVSVSTYIGDRLDLGRLRGHTRLVCIPNAVDLWRFSPAPVGTSGSGNDRFILGCAARLIEGKGIEDVVSALTHESLANAQLRVAGDGPRRAALEAFAAEQGVGARVSFLGPVRDMPRFWREVDLAVVPSNRLVESFGMSAIEAMACGKPVVVSDSGALPDVISDGETGRRVPAGDIPKLAEALADYVLDRERLRSHGLNARRRAEEHFGIERTADRYLQLCVEVMRGVDDTARDVGAA
jgi:glycosyltransferase involved in cell wall biosynthesis